MTTQLTDETEEYAMRMEAIRIVRRSLCRIGTSDANIIKYHFGFNGDERSLAWIADKSNNSIESIEFGYYRGMKLLRLLMRRDYPEYAE